MNIYNIIRYRNDKHHHRCTVSTRRWYEHDQNELTEGTQVVTGGGIYGTVKSIDLAKNTVDVKIARDVVITVDKGSVFKDPSSTPQPQK